MQPGPSNETWDVESVPGGGVIVRIYHIGGTHVSFMPPAMAETLSGILADAGRKANGGIVVPPPGFSLPPPPPPQ